MKKNETGLQPPSLKLSLIWVYIPAIMLGLLLFPSLSLAQPGSPFPPPKEIRVYTAQGISYGNFFPGTTGGTVVVDPNGFRSSTGSVVLAGGMFQPAIFIIELLPGRLVNIMLSPASTLTRVGGGGTLTMAIGPTSRGTSFVTNAGHPFRNPVQVGGTLYVGNISMNPSGSYEGTFDVTFIQE